MKTVCVTGGAGFLGSHLCESLLKDGNTVIALDNLSTGFVSNIKHLYEYPSFSFVEADVRDEIFVEAEEYYNLACPASPPKYQHDKIGTFLTNIMGVKNVLDAALENQAKVFQASTSEVYGDPEVHPQPESYRGLVNTVGPRSCYDEGKRAAETLLTDYSLEYDIPVKIVRIFNTYGPRMDPEDGRVITNFIMQALHNKDITIYGSGQQTRSFCFVEDEIRGFRLLMDKTPDSWIQPTNIGNPNEFDMLQLAELVIKLTQSNSKIVFNPLPVDDPRQRKPDITLAKDKLGWEPKIQLEEGLIRTIEYFKGISS